MTTRAYINGINVFEEICGGYQINTDLNLKFGRSSGVGNGDNNYPFKGKINNIHMWSKELSGEEILEYTNCAPSPNSSNLEALWTFEEGNGNTILDLSVTASS